MVSSSEKRSVGDTGIVVNSSPIRSGSGGTVFGPEGAGVDHRVNYANNAAEVVSVPSSSGLIGIGLLVPAD